MPRSAQRGAHEARLSSPTRGSGNPCRVRWFARKLHDDRGAWRGVVSPRGERHREKFGKVRRKVRARLPSKGAPRGCEGARRAEKEAGYGDRSESSSSHRLSQPPLLGRAVRSVLHLSLSITAVGQENKLLTKRLGRFPRHFTRSARGNQGLIPDRDARSEPLMDGRVGGFGRPSSPSRSP